MEQERSMEGDDILCGWAQIERFLGLTRKTILAHGFPVRKQGGVWALRGELLKHLGSFPEIPRKEPRGKGGATS